MPSVSEAQPVLCFCKYDGIRQSVGIVDEDERQGVFLHLPQHPGVVCKHAFHGAVVLLASFDGIGVCPDVAKVRVDIAVHS